MCLTPPARAPLQFTGSINVFGAPSTSVSVIFKLVSDDAGRVTIDGDPVIENTVQGTFSKESAVIQLATGFHTIE